MAESRSRCKTINATSVCLVLGDITKQQVDVIVNAANSSLMGGGGVDGAIHWAAGPSLLAECGKILLTKGMCPTGSAVITGAGNLHARHIVHAVGPQYQDGKHGEPDKLASAYRRSLELAHEAGAQTVAFPSISTGIYAYPVAHAAKIALTTVADFCRANVPIKEVRFVLFDDRTYEAYDAALNEL